MQKQSRKEGRKEATSGARGSLTLFEFYCNGRKIAAETKNGEDYDLVNVGGRLFRVELLKVGRNEYRARIDNDTIIIKFIEEGLDSYTLDIEGYVVEYRSRPEDSAGNKGKSVSILLSPLPGRILSIHVKNGQEVKFGDELVIIESMKMQTTLRAEHDCTIKEIKVREGEIIKRGQPIIEFMV
jgi:acetyl/propionyl-CoA carboxylase alpha subunit